MTVNLINEIMLTRMQHKHLYTRRSFAIYS